MTPSSQGGEALPPVPWQGFGQHLEHLGNSTSSCITCWHHPTSPELAAVRCPPLPRCHLCSSSSLRAPRGERPGGGMAPSRGLCLITPRNMVSLAQGGVGVGRTLSEHQWLLLGGKIFLSRDEKICGEMKKCMDTYSSHNLSWVQMKIKVVQLPRVNEILGTLAAYLTRVNSKSQLESHCDLF